MCKNPEGFYWNQLKKQISNRTEIGKDEDAVGVFEEGCDQPDVITQAVTY